MFFYRYSDANYRYSNDIYMTASTQITNTKIFAFIFVLVFQGTLMQI